MPRNKYPEETRRKIIEVSKKLFLEKGFEKTTILDIVDGLEGLSRGAFYHHFKSKDEVMEAVLEDRNIQNDPFNYIKGLKNLNGLQKIKQILVHQMKHSMQTTEQKQMVGMAISLLENPRFLAEQVKSNMHVSKLLAPIIQEGMDDGSIKKGNPQVLAELFMMTINFWFFPAVYPFDEETAEDKVMTVKQIFDALGMPVLDEEILGLLESFANDLQW